MGNLVLNGSTSGAITVSPPAISGTNTLTLPAATDTLVGKATTDTLTNKTLTSPVINTPTMGGSVITTVASQSIASASSVTFGSIPSWVKRITLNIYNVTCGGAVSPTVQLGTSGGLQTSSYNGAVGNSNTSATANSTGFIVSVTVASTNVLSGAMVFTLQDATTNVWCCTSVVTRSGTVQVNYNGGTVALSSTLTQLKFLSTDTFTAGTLNILYE